MDKLKPILAQKFWILSAVAFLLPVVGWWMATGELAAQIESRTTALDTAFGGIPSSANAPNDDYVQGIKVFTEASEKRNHESEKYLWQTQRGLMVWPDNIAGIMAKVPYRGEIPNVARDLYRSSYWFELQRTHKLADPLDFESGTGKLELTLDLIPQIDRQQWQDLPPTSDEMWDAQEDIWLVSSLLEALNRVNADSDTIIEAPIKQVLTLEVRGGNRADMEATPAGGDGGSGGAGMAGMGAMASVDAGGFGGFGGGQQSGTKQGNQSVDFSPEKEFGSDAGVATGGGGGGDSAGADAAAAPGGFSVMSQSSNLRRYVDDDESMPFKTRAFYIKVIMDHSRVPDLMVELTNAPWPVRIVRLHQSDLYGDDVDPVNATGGGARRRGIGAGMESAGAGLGGGGRRSAFQPPARRSASGPDTAAGVGGFDNSTAGQATQEVRNAQAAAMANPNLVEVVVAGLMTLYRPVEEEEAETEGTAEGTEPTAEGQKPDAPQEEPAATEPQPGSDQPKPASESDSPDGTEGDSKSIPPEKTPEENPKPPIPQPTSEDAAAPPTEKSESKKPDQDPDVSEKPDDNR